MSEAKTPDLRALREALRGFPELRLALVFGSVAREAAGRESDLDVAVLGREPLSGPAKERLIAALAAATGRPVDLVDLARAGEPLLGEILRGGRVVLEGDREARAELLRRHLLDEADFLPYRRRILAARRRAWLGR